MLSVKIEHFLIRLIIANWHDTECHYTQCHYAYSHHSELLSRVQGGQLYWTFPLSKDFRHRFKYEKTLVAWFESNLLLYIQIYMSLLHKSY
jgi:hypothetical protein